MKNLVPFIALLVLGGSLTLGSPVEAKGKQCNKKAKCEKASGGDECCKEGAKDKADAKTSADKPKEGEAKPAETK